MAVTATFKADFSDFTEKVNEANKILQGLETSAKKVGPALNNAGKQGEDGFSKMFAALKPLAGALGVTFSVGAVVAYAKSIADTASEIEKLSAKTGLSNQAVQRFQIVADAAGNTVQELAAAVSGMQRLLATGESSEALAKLGIELSHFRSLSPEQQFYELAAAIAAVKDPALQAQYAVETGTKAMLTALPSLKKGFDDVRDASVGMSDTAVKAWADLGNAAVAQARRVKDAVGEVIGQGLALHDKFWGQQQKDILQFNKSLEEQTALMTAAAKAAPSTAPAEMSTKGWGPKGAPDLTNQVQEMKDLVDVSEKHAAVMKKQEDAAKKYADALKDVSQYGGDFHTTLQGLNTDTVEAVKYYIQAGASLSNLATVYGLTDAQVKAINADLTFQKTVVDQSSKGFANVATSIANAESRLVAFREAAYGVQSDLTLMNEGMSRMGAAGAIMGQGMEDGSARIGEAMGRGKSSIGDFIGKITGDFNNFAATGLSGIIGAFTGEGGIAGAATSMAKTVTSQVLGLIPLAGPILSQLAGPIIDGFKKIGGALKDLFGGPNADELAGRQVVDKFQANLGSMLNETQKVEAGNVQWKATVIAIRDAYLANGLSAEEAMADAQRLWGATGEGAAASQAAVELVNQKMKGFTDQTNAAIDQARGLADALHDVGRAASSIDFPSGNPSVGVPGYATGTGGRFVNFGQGTLAMLHGRERVMTEGEVTSSDPAMLGALQAIRRDLQRQPELIALQLRAALAQV